MQLIPIPECKELLADRFWRRFYFRSVRVAIRKSHLYALESITAETGMSPDEWLDQMIKEKLRDRKEFQKIVGD